MLTVKESFLQVTLSVPGITDEQFEALCEKYENYRVEYAAEGELVVMPPADPETSSRNGDINVDLELWNRRNRKGVVTDSSGGFLLPDGSRLAPDAAWISRGRLKKRPTCPEFVIELLSPSDRPRKTHGKMLNWIANGALLGWMINPQTRTVTIYRPNREPEVRKGISRIEGEGPVAGLVLDLDPIWAPV